jgi:two-component system, OmpR family, phosphate regulon response regulator OmpR
MMPGEDGLSICRRLRAARNPIAIVILTAKGDPIDRILGLEMGADDYLAKPFTPRELSARLHAVLRRSRLQSHPADEIMTFGPYTLNLSAMTLTRDLDGIALSSKEFALLRALAINAGRPLSRAQIVDLAHGRDADVTDRAIDVQISRLRKAIGDDPVDPVWIKTVWGVGYVFAGSTAS